MSVAIPDENELRKVFSPRTVEWLRQISEIPGIELNAAGLALLIGEVEAAAQAVARKAVGGIVHELGMMRAELAAERSRNVDLRARIEHLERVTA